MDPGLKDRVALVVQTDIAPPLLLGKIDQPK